MQAYVNPLLPTGSVFLVPGLLWFRLATQFGGLQTGLQQHCPHIWRRKVPHHRPYNQGSYTTVSMLAGDHV
jgi:hypothetical protein